MFSTIMTIINICSLILIAVVYFREHYTIVSLEQWNELAHFYNEHVESEQEDSEEKAGGCGFFWEYISPLEEEYEEDE